MKLNGTPVVPDPGVILPYGGLFRSGRPLTSCVTYRRDGAVHFETPLHRIHSNPDQRRWVRRGRLGRCKNACLHFKASLCLVCNKVRCGLRWKEAKKREKKTTKTLLRAKDCVRDDEKCEGFLRAEVHVGPGEGGGARGTNPNPRKSVHPYSELVTPPHGSFISDRAPNGGCNY